MYTQTVTEILFTNLPLRQQSSQAVTLTEHVNNLKNHSTYEMATFGSYSEEFKPEVLLCLTNGSQLSVTIVNAHE